MKKENMKKNSKFYLRKEFLIALFVILLALAIVLNLVFNSLEEKKAAEREWLSDNCKCIEWEGEKSCPSGFELIRGFCRKGDTITSFLKACSKYNCTGELVEIG